MTERRPLRARVTLSHVRGESLERGHHFFDRATMKCFGDTMKSFRLTYDDNGDAWLVRTRPMRDRNGRNMGGVGQRRRVYDDFTIGVPE